MESLGCFARQRSALPAPGSQPKPHFRRDALRTFLSSRLGGGGFGYRLGLLSKYLGVLGCRVGHRRSGASGTDSLECRVERSLAAPVFILSRVQRSAVTLQASCKRVWRSRTFVLRNL